jgi:hypothetical protein
MSQLVIHFEFQFRSCLRLLWAYQAAPNSTTIAKLVNGLHSRKLGRNENAGIRRGYGESSMLGERWKGLTVDQSRAFATARALAWSWHCSRRPPGIEERTRRENDSRDMELVNQLLLQYLDDFPFLDPVQTQARGPFAVQTHARCPSSSRA